MERMRRNNLQVGHIPGCTLDVLYLDHLGKGGQRPDN
jgi:hypothetical protein